MELIPRNPLEAAVRALDGEMLQLMIFALIFGVAVSAATPADDRDNILVRLLEQVFDACMRIVQFVMKLSPLAVFAIIFNTAFTFGTGVFASLALYVVTVVTGPALQRWPYTPSCCASSASAHRPNFSGSAARCISTRFRPHRRMRRSALAGSGRRDEARAARTSQRSP